MNDNKVKHFHTAIDNLNDHLWLEYRTVSIVMEHQLDDYFRALASLDEPGSDDALRILRLV